MEKPKILILDDIKLAKLLYENLTPTYTVFIYDDPIAATLITQSKQFDLIILDFHLNHSNCTGFIETVRSFGQKASFIVMCENPSPLEVQFSLRQRVDDFVFKPLDLTELRRRIMLAIINKQFERECLCQQSIPATNSTIIIGPLAINIERETAHLYDQTVELTSTEFCILHRLALSVGQYLSASYILGYCREYALSNEEAHELIKPHISHLRHKLEMNGRCERMIRSKRGAGFALIVPT